MHYRIEEARKARGWTQQQLAEAAHTTQPAIQRYESGEREPKVSAIVAMSAALNVTISYLLGFDDDPLPISATTLTDDEAELVRCYRSSDDGGRASILAVARTLAGGTAPASAREVREAV